jgi:hypothetical protein
MAETTTQTTPSAGLDDKTSMWAAMLKLTSFKSDPKYWNEQWENTLNTLTPQEVIREWEGCSRRREKIRT